MRNCRTIRVVWPVGPFPQDLQEHTAEDVPSWKRGVPLQLREDNAPGPEIRRMQGLEMGAVEAHGDK